MSEATTAVLHRLEAVLNSNQVDAGLEALLAPQVAYNGRHIPVQAITQARVPLWAAVPDLRWTLEDLVVAGERAATLWCIAGTHAGDFLHPILGKAPATSQAIHCVFALFCRVIDGKIVEAQDVSDRLALFQQVRILPNLGLGEITHTVSEAAPGR